MKKSTGVNWVEYRCEDGVRGFIRGTKIRKTDMLFLQREHGKVTIIGVVNDAIPIGR